MRWRQIEEEKQQPNKQRERNRRNRDNEQERKFENIKTKRKEQIGDEPKRENIHSCETIVYLRVYEIRICTDQVKTNKKN